MCTFVCYFDSRFGFSLYTFNGITKIVRRRVLEVPLTWISIKYIHYSFRKSSFESYIISCHHNTDKIIGCKTMISSHVNMSGLFTYIIEITWKISCFNQDPSSYQPSPVLSSSSMPVTFSKKFTLLRNSWKFYYTTVRPAIVILYSYNLFCATPF